MHRIRLITTLAVLLGAMALAAGGASAATTWFGSSLNHEPANAGSGCDTNNSSSLPVCTHVGSFYPGTSGRAKATANGTIVKVKVRAQSAMKLRFEVVRVKNLSSNHEHGQAKMLVQGPTIHVPGPTNSGGGVPVQSFKVHIHVSKGNELAITTSNNQAEYCADGTPGQLTFFNPALKIGQGFRHNSGVDGCLLLVQAVIKH
jgi:hypothetical protein